MIGPGLLNEMVPGKCIELDIRRIVQGLQQRGTRNRLRWR